MKRVIILICRNLGDAIIASGLVESIGRSFPGCQIDLLLRERCGDIFRNNPFINKMYYANFPLGNPKNFGLREAVKLVKTVAGLKKYDFCINNIGHIGENFISRCIRADKSVSIAWEKGHPFNNHIGIKGDIIANSVVRISSTMLNVYDANRYLASKLGCKVIRNPHIYLQKHIVSAPVSLEDLSIGIHPFASIESKLWPFKKWHELVRCLIQMGAKVRLYGTASDRPMLYNLFGDFIEQGSVVLQLGDLESFFKSVQSLRLLIGLDSFAVHAAYALGVPSIMLNGSNDFRVWQPPGSEVVCSTGACNHQPCYNKPKCIGTSGQYACIKGISVNDVMDKIHKLLTEQY